ncbi:PepSY domain-containing protein [Novosphingobium sp. MW5]|nr:PepSY domain-containing protein [Novosphingobium sp. MW5]
MARSRQIVRRIHLWLGLGLGALMVLAGLTGSALVFYVEIDAWLHPEQSADGSASPVSYDQAISTLRTVFPDKQGQWRFEVTGRPGAIPARYYSPPETAGRDFAPMMVWLSPDGTRVLRRDFWGDYAMTWIYDLHYRLQFGKTGGVIFGYAGLGLLALLISGLWAWWPRGSWAKALRFKRHAPQSRRLRDIHKLAGLLSLPLLATLTITGVMLALPDESSAVLAPLLGEPTPIPSPRSKRESGEQIEPSIAIAAARQAMPQARIAWIEVPGSGRNAFRLRLRQSSDPSSRFPHSFIWIDQHDGEVIDQVDSRRMPASSIVISWLHPLHDGSVGGFFVRWLVLITGAFPLLLFWSGLSRWYLISRKLSP